jgi:hypothetical protein
MSMRPTVFCALLLCLAPACLTLPGSNAPTTGIYRVDGTIQSSNCVNSGSDGLVGGVTAFAESSQGTQNVQVPDFVTASGAQDYVVFTMQGGSGTVNGSVCGASLTRSISMQNQDAGSFTLQETVTWSGTAQTDASCANASVVPAGDCTMVRNLQYTLVQTCSLPLRLQISAGGVESCVETDGGAD